MNSKTAKKVRKQVRKETRAIFGEGLEAMGRFIRPRPQWVPRWIWIALYLPLFKRETIRYLYRYI